MNKIKTRVVSYGNTTALLLPADLLKDSTYPFKVDSQSLIMEIRGEEIIIRKANKGEKL